MKKILVIDDDSIFAQNISKALSEKYNVLTSEDGEDGLKKALEENPDAILLDIMMPKMNGLELLKQLNEKHGKGKVPVFITSNMSSMRKISEGLELGIAGYIIKSDETIETIIDTIENTLAKQAKQ